MRRTRCGRCLLLLSTLFLFVPALANAQTNPPGVCTDSWSSVCSANNTCPESNTSCNVQISHSGTTAIVVYGGNTVSDVCVYPAQIINWQEAEQNAEFTVQFLTTPFSSNQYLFQGSTGTPSPGTITNPPANGCFKFTIRQQVGTTIYPADPKVVVHGVGTTGEGKKKHKRKRTEEEQPQPQQP